MTDQTRANANTSAGPAPASQPAAAREVVTSAPTTTTATEMTAPPPAAPAPIAKAAESDLTARKAGPPEESRSETANVVTETTPRQQQDRDDASRVYSGAANTTGIMQQAPKAVQTRRGAEGGGESANTGEQQRGYDYGKARQGQRAARDEERRAPNAMTEPPARSRVRRESAPPAAAASPKPQQEASEETRSAGGRQFRRQNGVWVDTAYRSQRVTTLTRGSERYRALVADEPGIDQIARQLGGEILLVWNGRAYRIK